MADLAVVDPDPAWPVEFGLLEADLADACRGLAARIDHIGSTSVPGLAAKDVIDVQVTVASDDELVPIVEALSLDGFVHKPGRHDLLTGCDDAEQLRKELFVERRGERRANIHVRIGGRRNQRYALLFRDFLRADPAARDAYGGLKRHLASLYPDDAEGYDAIKDPVMDLIYRGAEAWAEATGWEP